MKLINLTPHNLDIIDEEGNANHIPRTEIEAGRFLLLRATTHNEVLPNLGKFQVVRTAFGAAEIVTTDATGKDPKPFTGNLPSADAFIVSLIALTACSGELRGVRCFAPEQLLRNEQGQPIGAKGLISL